MTELDGPLAAADQVFTLGGAAWGHAVAALTLWILVRVGGRITSALGWAEGLESEIPRLLAAWVVGFVASTAAGLVLVPLGLLNGPVVTVLGSFVILDAVREVWLRRRGQARPPATGAQRPGMPRRRTLAVAALILVWAVPYAIQTLLFNADWDSASYHLPMAGRYLEGQLWNTDPSLSSLSFPGAMHLIYAGMLAVGAEAAIIPFNAWLSLLTLVATWRLGRVLGGRSAAWWAAAVLMACPLVWQLGLDPRIDGALALFCTLACLFFLGWRMTGRREPFLPLAALSLSAALGTKYTALPLAACLGAATLVWQRRDRERIGADPASRGQLSRNFVLLALVLLPNGAWYVANASIHGDPIFPLLRGAYVRDASGDLSLETALAEHGQELERHGEAAIAMAEHQRRRESHDLFDLWSLLTDPDAHADKPDHGLGPLLLLALLLPLAWGGLQPATRAPLLVLLAAACVHWIALGSRSHLARYLLPIVPILALGAGLVLARWRHRLVQLPAALLVLGLLAGQVRAQWQQLARLDAGGLLSGAVTRIEWLADVGYNSSPSMARFTAFANAEHAAGRLGSSPRIFMIGEGKARLLTTGALPDFSTFGQGWLAALLEADFDHDTLKRQLRDAGVTHVLYGAGYYIWVLGHARIDTALLAFEVDHLRRFAAAHGRVIYNADGVQVFALR